MADRSTFGKYVLLRKLATGGMGEVFLAKQVGPSGFEKLLVIKRILAQHHDKHEYLNMFLSEARLVAYLTHSNIIQIHEMGQIDGDYFIAMEYVRGRSLRDVIDALRSGGKQLPLPYVIDLAIKLCDGLGYAHEARDIRGRPMNIIHRDINPHNVLVSYGGDLKIIDFGIAKSEMTDVHTATGTIKGKFVYMSPEQSAADPIDRRSDIFSLGIVLYEMATGENPFVRQNVVLSLEAIQRHAVPHPSTKRADAGPLDAVLMKALEKKPEDRFQNAYEMRDELRNLLRGGLVRPMDNDLSGFLHELFKADIEEEDRLLAEADRATSPPRPSMPVPSSPEPRLPANLPSMPAFTGPPASGPGAPSDPDTKADRPMRTPVPIRAAAFSDDEPTQATDIGEMAARSRAQSLISRNGGMREPTGQVFTLIAADELAPGTNEEYSAPIGSQPASSEPHTKRERLPLPTGTEETPAEAVQSSEDLPSAALSEPIGSGIVRQRMGSSAPPPPPRPSFPLMAAALTTSSAIESAEDPGEHGALSVPPIASTSAKPAPIPSSPGDLASMRGEISRSNGALRTPPRPVPSAPSISMPPASHGHQPAIGDARDESSASLPVYTGTSRRSTLVAGVLVFALAAVAGFWGVRSVMGMWGDAEDAIPSDLAEATPTPLPPSGFAPPEPARDPAEAPTAADLRPTPSPTPVASASPAASPVASPVASPAASPIASPSPRPSASAAPPKPTVEPKIRREKEPKITPKPSKSPRPAVEAVAPREEPRATAEPKPEPKRTPEPKPEPEAPKPEPKAEAKPEPKAAASRLGIVTLSASAEVSVEHDGRPAGSSPSSMMIRGESGTITLSAPSLPYTVKLSYKVVDGELSVKVDTNPWSIVKHNGISLGKTPQEPDAGRRHKFSLLRPGQPAPLDVSLLWNPTNK